VIFVRHQQTEFNRVFSVTRQDPGVPRPTLTDHGRRQTRAVAGLKVPNGAVLRIDPTRPDREPELLFVPDAG